MIAFADLDPDQQRALLEIEAWIATEMAIRRTTGRYRRQVFRLFGYAGTGKTMIIGLLRRRFANPNRIAFVAYTGKAAQVLRMKGCDDASTIHQAIFRREHNPGDARQLPERMIPVDKLPFTKPKKTKGSDEPDFSETGIRDVDLIVVDECSMINEELARALLHTRRLILVTGDPAQLPPVRGEPGFTNIKPDVLLTQIHRQQAGSSVLAIATYARREGYAPGYGQYGSSRIYDGRQVSPAPDLLAADQIICGANTTRYLLNHWMRRQLGLAATKDDWLPVKGDKLICLKNNYVHQPAVLNGSLWRVEEATPGRGEQSRREMVGLWLRSLDLPGRKPLYTEVPAGPFAQKEPYEEFFDQFDFGYAITTHKAQGSEWKRIAIINEQWLFRKFSKNPRTARSWLYTAITRAQEQLTLIEWWRRPSEPPPPKLLL